MAVTLTLTDTQVVMLDALFRSHSPEEITNAVNNEFKEFFEDDTYNPSTYAYALAVNSFSNDMFDDYDTSLYNTLEDAVYNIGLTHEAKARKLLNNKTKEINK